ncbi:MAG: polysaccharide deacetylase family protein [Bacteroidales bacterium]|nr:polysaccharide deacetylase family protein [Bacteroidales bacterium]
MLPSRTPYLVKKIYYHLTWDLPGYTNTVYLTFDDGPAPEVTGQVLEHLKKYDARATFFCIGRNTERYPDLYNRIRSEGHAVGNHTYSHLNGMKTKNVDYFNDIQLAQTFTPSDLFRPPYGMIRPSQIRHLRKLFTIIMWSVMSYDYDPDVTKEKCLSNILTNVRPGSIVVFHDSLKASEKVLYVLPRLLEFLKEKKYRCDSIAVS